MGCGTSKPQKTKGGKREYRMRMDPETTTTDLIDRGEPEGEEKVVENGWQRDGTNGVQQEMTSRPDKESITSLANLTFNDKQVEAKTAIKPVLRK